MRLFNTSIIISLFFTSAVIAQQKPQSTLPRPKLVVGIVVDQMRWDFLYRYNDRYGDGGFKRLLKQGFTCENANIPYIPTFTACGHASIYTGSVPAINGIAGNDWYNQETGKRVYCTEDYLSRTVGSTSTAGEMSPRNLLSSTVGDELKLATNFKSKVLGIALKDRGGILPAGHSADAAYWFDDATGGWISSTYYMNQLPQWVQQFNNQKQVEKYIRQGWNTLYPVTTYVQSTADNNHYEGKFQGETSTSFPHTLTGGKGLGVIRYTPFANTLTVDFAKAAIRSEALGKDEATDLLAVSFSSTDYIGHQFGPNSIEVEDTYLRLDKDLEGFFNYLDTEVGKGQYVVFLSADHGAAHNPTYLKDRKMPAGYWDGDQVKKDLNSKLKDKFGAADLVLANFNYQIHFNNRLIEHNKLNKDEIIKESTNFLSKLDAVAFAIPMKELSASTLPEILKERIGSGYNPKRSGDIQIMLNPAWFQGYGTTGTTHGTWNPYDAHIPLVFMGWGIKPGSTNRPVKMSDIASTLSALLHIQEPNGNIGQPITEVLE
ncbi:alkaline phosphatase PafA [Pedobacter sp. SYSU D00535]|uniref:alkaline phosphatase PafA n=1 Tax=Pedobacter sp. SYSU D00535 TaxID=2810308 RepID=UPI001A97877F|nr:alkaline phosphatase PafA [Pedobacter sp. SYSU D00535]